MVALSPCRHRNWQLCTFYTFRTDFLQLSKMLYTYTTTTTATNTIIIIIIYIYDIWICKDFSFHIRCTCSFLLHAHIDSSYWVLCRVENPLYWRPTHFPSISLGPFTYIVFGQYFFYEYVGMWWVFPTICISIALLDYIWSVCVLGA